MTPDGPDAAGGREAPRRNAPGGGRPPPRRAAGVAGEPAGRRGQGRGRRTDPLGKRALFGPPPGVVTGDTVEGGGTVGGPTVEGGDHVADPFAPASGRRRALFSEGEPIGAPTPPGRWAARRVATLTCRSCGTRTPLDALGMWIRLMTSVWVPRRRWSRFLRCPACGRLAWCRIAWGG